jgi:hypothetical protein
MHIQAMTVMLSGLEDATSGRGDAKAAFVDGVLNWKSHQMEIAKGMENANTIPWRMVRSAVEGTSGGIGMILLTSKAMMHHAAVKPAKIRIVVRAHDRRRKSPTEVQMPKQASAAIIAVPAMAN